MTIQFKHKNQLSFDYDIELQRKNIVRFTVTYNLQTFLDVHNLRFTNVTGW